MADEEWDMVKYVHMDTGEEEPWPGVKPRAVQFGGQGRGVLKTTVLFHIPYSFTRKAMVGKEPGPRSLPDLARRKIIYRGGWLKI
ncbi:MAG: hypothetical protein ACUVRX_06005 [Actinomycetota bacterium]